MAQIVIANGAKQSCALAQLHEIASALSAPRNDSSLQVSLAGTKQRMVPLIGERHKTPRAIGLAVP